MHTSVPICGQFIATESVHALLYPIDNFEERLGFTAAACIQESCAEQGSQGAEAVGTDEKKTAM